MATPPKDVPPASGSSSEPRRFPFSSKRRCRPAVPSAPATWITRLESTATAPHNCPGGPRYCQTMSELPPSGPASTGPPAVPPAPAAEPAAPPLDVPAPPLDPPLPALAPAAPPFPPCAPPAPPPRPAAAPAPAVPPTPPVPCPAVPPDPDPPAPAVPALPPSADPPAPAGASPTVGPWRPASTAKTPASADRNAGVVLRPCIEARSLQRRWAGALVIEDLGGQ